MIQSETRIILPASARGLNFHYKPPIDPAFTAKIEIDGNSKDEMTTNISAIKNDDNTHVLGDLGTKLSWWIPKTAKVIVERQTFVDGNYLHVTLTEEGAAVMVYIEWWVI